MLFISRIAKDRFVFSLYVMLMCTMLFMSAYSKYGDCIAYTQWTVNIWDALFSGRIREYFLVSAEKLRGYHCGNVYGILYLVPWGIWNFPLWLSRVITGTASVAGTLCLLWSKIFLILCAHILSVYCVKIIRVFAEDGESYASAGLYILSGGTMFLSVTYFGQDEIIYMASFVAAVYYIVVGNRLFGYILLGISCMLNAMMFVPSLAVLLIKEKNLLVVFALSICFVLPEKIISSFCGIGQLPEIAKEYALAPSFPLRTLIDWFFGCFVFKSADWSVSVYTVCLVVLYVFCYLWKHENLVQENKAVVLWPALSLFAMTIFSWLHAYRWFVCIPLLAVCVFIKSGKSDSCKIGLLFVSLFDLCRILLLITFDYCLRFSSFHIGCIDRFYDSHDFCGDFYDLFYKVIGSSWLSVYQLFVSSACIGFAVLYLVFLIKKKCSFHLNLSGRLLLVLHSSLPVLLTICVLLLPFLVPKLLRVQGRLLLTDLGYYPDKTISFDMKDCKCIETEFSLSEKTSVHRVAFRAYTWNNNYNSSRLILTITKDAGDMRHEYVASFPLSSVKNNDITEWKLDGCVLEPGKYILSLQVDELLDSDFSLATNPDVDAHNLKYNSSSVDGYRLCLEIIGKGYSI